MGKKVGKRTKKFAKSGGIKKAIEARKKHQKTVRPIKQTQERRARVKGKEKAKEAEDDESGSEAELPEGSKFLGMSVDDFLKGDFMDEEDSEDEDGSDDEDDGDSASFASVDEYDDEEQHAMELSALAKKDPEFYQYLMENDRGLLDFAQSGADADADMLDMEDDTPKEMLTEEMLKTWQANLLKYRSLRALRQLLNAFRASSNLDDDNDGEVRKYRAESRELFDKLVSTTLKYTPVVLVHHMPYKELPDGRFKPPVINAKNKTIGKMIASYVSSIVRLMDQITDDDTHQMALTESAKVIPYVSNRRKVVKEYLKMCLEMWSKGDDRVRLAAYMGLRRLVSSSETGLLDMVLKASYLTMVRNMSKSNEHTLPALNLMKNTGAELYCVNQTVSYQHAFGYIRQLAIHLRNSMKGKNQDALKQVYNWQFVHCIDFWCLVLAKACDQTSSFFSKGESELKPLIYPLVQVTIGALKLAPGMRHYPFHIHLIRSLLHLTRHTKTYIPLAPFILPMLTTPMSPTAKYQPSKSKPLDLSLLIRVPKGHIRTRIMAENVMEEATFLLGEFCETVQTSIAFPEMMVPILVTLKRAIKKSKGGKGVVGLKVLLERIQDGCKWVETKREKVRFGPGDASQVAQWENEVEVDETPVAKWVKVQRKARANQEAMRKKAITGEAEMLDDEDDVEDEDEDDEDDE